MRTLIDVSLFVHTRLAWKTIFHAGDNSCRLVRLSLSTSPLSLSLLVPSGPTLSPRLSRLPLPHALDRQRGPRGPLEPRHGISSPGPKPRHELYGPRVRFPPRVACACPRVYQEGGEGGGAKLGSWSGLSSNKCLAISDIRQPDTSNLYRAPPRAPTLGKNYLDVSLAWCDCCVVAVRDRPGVMISVVLVGRELGRARVIGM